MIDYIKILIANFSGIFDECESFYRRKSITYYKLYNPEKKNSDVYLLLGHNESKNLLSIEYSLRQWYFGGNSLSDLTKENLGKVFKKIADLLNIHILDLYTASFTKCELGFNLMLKIPMRQLEPMIIEYSTLKRYCYEGETVGFRGSDRILKVYDKFKEIIEDSKGDEKSKRKKECDAFSKHNYHFVRPEIKMKDKESFIHSGLEHVMCVGDILKYYQDLYCFWAEEISKVVLLNEIIEDDSMKFKESLIAKVLKHEGYLSYKRLCFAKIKPKNRRCEILREAKDVIKKYANMEEYNTKKFRADVYKKMQCINRTRESLNMERLRKILLVAPTKKKHPNNRKQKYLIYTKR